MVDFEVASFNSFRDINNNHFETAAAADIDDSLKRKRFRVSLNKSFSDAASARRRGAHLGLILEITTQKNVQ